MRLSLVIVVTFLLFGAARPGVAIAAQDAPPTPASGITMPAEPRNGLIMPDLGPDATQADYGAEVYRLVCKACHGDKGQGLTPDWIAQWAPEDQNCWQLKCHAENHPPEGFVLPREVPPVLGAEVADRFRDGQQLHNYIAAAMPWQDRGVLQPEEYWQVTAYLLTQHGVDLTGVTLDADNAASFEMSTGAATPEIVTAVAAQTTPGIAATRQAERAAGRAAEEAQGEGWPWGWGALLLGSMVGAIWVFATAIRQI